MLRAMAVSHPGVRRMNEDSYLCSEELSLFVVADGMGGHVAGEVASRLAIEAIEQFMRRSQQGGDYSWPCGIDTGLTLNGNRLRTAIHLANRRVFRASESRDDYSGMGTTVVSALIAGSQLVVGHVGDSRLYLLVDGSLTLATRDDSWAATVLAAGVTNDTMKSHPMRHVLTNVLGVREEADIHVSERMLEPRTTLLLCTDGLHNVVDDNRLRTLIGDGNDGPGAAEALVNEALSRGSRDNVTAMLIWYDGEA
jgi:serine/threonine protein phosphatase PrpC